MRYSVGLPTARADATEEFVSAAAIAEMARTAERAGYGACYVTDHPAPDQRWLDTGGHHALDPLVALSFAAAATETLRLQTHVFVLPYRNPFIVAKGLLTLDVLSGGRVTFGVAAGYLRSEFNTLGVDYEERNELTDEAIHVLKLVLTQDEVAYEGRHFRSRGTTLRPRSVQQPHPPIWVGGNSRRAIRRAVDTAQGWCPFPNPAVAASALHTPKLESIAELGDRIAYAHEYTVSIGRSEPLDICFAPLSLSMFGERDYDVYAVHAEVAELEAIGVTWMPVEFGASTRSEWIARVEQFAADVV